MTPKRVLFSILFVTVIAAAISLSCSLSDSMAGGTGVGNPTVTVSLFADTGSIDPDGMLAPSPSFLHRVSRLIPIVDDDSLVLLAASMIITVEKIHFYLDASENSYELLEKLNDSRFDADSESIILNGPFTFDVLTGASIPPIDSAQLPAAKYTGIKLHITNLSHVNDYAIEVFGTFEYKDAEREFSILMEENANAFYKFDEPVIELTEDDSVRFLLFLDADEWLSSVSLKGYLDNNEISLDPNGNLVIDKSTNTAPYKDFKKSFKQNIIRSGYLHIVPLVL